MLRNPAVGKVNPRTLQPRHRAVYLLRLRQTIHDQDVTMVQPNRRGTPPGARDEAGTPQNGPNSY